MRTVILIILLFVEILTIGCSNSRFCTIENELVCDLYETGVTEHNTQKLVFEGSESNYGTIRVKIDDTDVIDKIWFMLKNSQPNGKHFACGWVTIEFYDSVNKSQPNAKLLAYCGGADAGIYVKETKRTIYDEGNMCFVGLYQCPGLEPDVMHFLEKEFIGGK